MRQIANKHFLIRVYNYSTKSSQIVRYNGLVKAIGLARYNGTQRRLQQPR